MAYLISLRKMCMDCSKTAMVALRSRCNEMIGSYCRSCGARALQRQKQIEKQNDADIARDPSLAAR
jgi:predicted sulfurtransferase